MILFFVVIIEKGDIDGVYCKKNSYLKSQSDIDIHERFHGIHQLTILSRKIRKRKQERENENFL